MSARKKAAPVPRFMPMNHQHLACAACGSLALERSPQGQLLRFGTLLDDRGGLHGYALCRSCAEEAEGDRAAMGARVAEAFRAGR